MKQKENTKKNPTVKVGDKILVTKCRNGNTQLLNKISTVTSISSYQINVVTDTGQHQTVFRSGPKDEWVIASWDIMAEEMKKRITTYKKEIKALEQEYKMYSEYESEEAYVGAKIHKMIKANGKDAIVDIIKEMKKTNLM